MIEEQSVPPQKIIPRSEFLRGMGVVGAGLVLGACASGQDKPAPTGESSLGSIKNRLLHYPEDIIAHHLSEVESSDKFRFGWEAKDVEAWFPPTRPSIEGVDNQNEYRKKLLIEQALPAIGKSRYENVIFLKNILEGDDVQIIVRKIKDEEFFEVKGHMIKPNGFVHQLFQFNQDNQLERIHYEMVIDEDKFREEDGRTVLDVDMFSICELLIHESVHIWAWQTLVNEIPTDINYNQHRDMYVEILARIKSFRLSEPLARWVVAGIMENILKDKNTYSPKFDPETYLKSINFSNLWDEIKLREKMLSTTQKGDWTEPEWVDYVRGRYGD
jgi:hypothetical protein